MVSSHAKACGVHLVGSMPYASMKEALDALPFNVKGKLLRIPDGEPGVRGEFVRFQDQCFLDRKRLQDQPLSTGYDDAAVRSYKQYRDHRKELRVETQLQFQVCLPNPLNAIWACVDADFRNKVAPGYCKLILDSLDQIQWRIPHKDLAIQWDCAIDFAYIEYEQKRIRNPEFRPPFESGKPAAEECLDQLVHVSGFVAADVSLGYHFCYGDMGHKHFVQPETLGHMVEYANNITKRMSGLHDIQWFHMPVPKDLSNKDDYFRPLRNLEIGKAMLYLGLVHPNDGDECYQKLVYAKKYYSGPVGIGTECGLGRTSKDDLKSIFQISSDLCT